ncbi:hypothetical protein AVEN_62577-1 [Araneus ventricosus]|uniref:Uncharacterized protein n=1 Tax=Araneus ventricosus TaxID=182803 RepID=A0A4Y2NXK2_ARAVE|nr:hypothetical protein AVEN_62577-1 [Araneus ventricosus]
MQLHKAFRWSALGCALQQAHRYHCYPVHSLILARKHNLVGYRLHRVFSHSSYHIRQGLSAKASSRKVQVHLTHFHAFSDHFEAGNDVE